MNKALYIAGIGLSVVFLMVIGFFIGEVQDARFDALLDSMRYDYNSYSSYSSYSSGSIRANEATVSAGVASLIFFLFYIAMDILGMIKIKTQTIKVLSIIGLSFSGLMLLWNFSMMANPGSISFDEVGGVWGLYALVMLAFSIVGLVQSIKFGQRSKTETAVIDQDPLE